MRLIMTSEIATRNSKIDAERLWEHASLGKSYYKENTFLSYTFQDRKHAPAIIDILSNHGANVCTAKRDSKQIAAPNKDTVWEIRYALERCRKFVYFVTPGSKDHQWAPWELGYMDGKIGHANIAIFAASDSGHEMTWTEQGYLGLYQRIIWGSFADSLPEWLVYNHHDHTAMTLKEWIR